jgi:ferric-dicitrate binding protein FerR (iron transport regulator)
MNESEVPMQNGNDPIARLIRHAGAREPAPAVRFERAKAQVATHWQEVVAAERGRHRRAWARRFTAAAAVVVAVGAGLLASQRSSPPAQPMATVTRVSGEALVNGEAVAVGDRVATNALIRTDAGGRLALQLDSGHSLRLDHGSRLAVTAADRFELARGAVYVDSGSQAAQKPVQIATPFGTATELGTQFQLRLAAERLEIGVREGLVRIAREPGSFDVSAGTLVRIGADGHGVELPLAARSPWWAWVETVPAEFDVEGTTLEQYLSWYARERGLELRWQNPTSRERAARIRLSGSIHGLDLDEGLRTVGRIAEFSYALTGSVLQVSVE